MARPRIMTPLRRVANAMDELARIERELQLAYPDLRRVPVAMRPAIKEAREHCAAAGVALREIIRLDARTALTLDEPADV